MQPWEAQLHFGLLQQLQARLHGETVEEKEAETRCKVLSCVQDII